MMECVERMKTEMLVINLVECSLFNEMFRPVYFKDKRSIVSNELCNPLKDILERVRVCEDIIRDDHFCFSVGCKNVIRRTESKEGRVERNAVPFRNRSKIVGWIDVQHPSIVLYETEKYPVVATNIDNQVIRRTDERTYDFMSISSEMFNRWCTGAC